MLKGIVVHNPSSIVLVDNVSNGYICLPRDGKSDIIVAPKKSTQLSWAEFVYFKSMPGFGHNITLNDSVVISDGIVKIKNASVSLSDDYMIGVLVQGISLIKEFILSLNDGDREVFLRFLRSRKELGIEEEKCEEAISFIEEKCSPGLEEVDEVESNEPQKKRPGRRKKVEEGIENVS